MPKFALKIFTRYRALFSLAAGLVVLTLVVAVACLVFGAREEGSWGSFWLSADEVRVEKLPAEARQTLSLIKAGGPFPHRQDGRRFRNREKKLPIKPRGYYRSYVVATPGVTGAGERRIIAGAGPDGNFAKSGEYWYTDNNCEILHRIRE